MKEQLSEIWQFPGSTRKELELLLEETKLRKDKKADEFNRFLQYMLEEFDFEGFDAQLFKHRPSGQIARTGPIKFLELTRWLPPRFYRALDLELNGSTPKVIFDLGTGLGYFPYICRYFGHSIQTIDVDECEIFNDMINLLGIPRTVHRIRPGKSLPSFGYKFDIVTAFMVTFNAKNSNELYGEEDWDFFLTDILDNILNPGGLLFMEMNDQKRHQRGLHHKDPGFNSMLKRLGVTFRKHRQYVWIQRF